MRMSRRAQKSTLKLFRVWWGHLPLVGYKIQVTLIVYLWKTPPQPNYHRCHLCNAPNHACLAEEGREGNIPDRSIINGVDEIWTLNAQRRQQQRRQEGDERPLSPAGRQPSSNLQTSPTKIFCKNHRLCKFRLGAKFIKGGRRLLPPFKLACC